MSEEPMPELQEPTPEPMPVTRSVSPWWALLILPVTLIAFWGFGRLSNRNPQEPQTAAQLRRATVSMPPSPMVAATRRSSVIEEKPAEPTPKMKSIADAFAGVSEWTTLELAMAESQRNGKPVLIDFNAAWCAPCQAMKELVFEDKNLGKEVQSAVIPVSIVDRMREEGKNSPQIENLQQRFDVDIFPTLIVFSPATGKAVKTQGFVGAERTAAWIVESAKAVQRV